MGLIIKPSFLINSLSYYKLENFCMVEFIFNPSIFFTSSCWSHSRIDLKFDHHQINNIYQINNLLGIAIVLVEAELKVENGGERWIQLQKRRREGAERPTEDSHRQKGCRSGKRQWNLPRRQRDAGEGSDAWWIALSPEEEVGADHPHPGGARPLRGGESPEAAAPVHQVEIATC